MPRTRRQVREDISECLEMAKWFALAYSAIATVGFAIRFIPFVRDLRTFFTGIVVLLGVLLFYWLTAMWGGLVVGVLRPWTASALGAVVLGLLVAFPMSLGALPFLRGGMPKEIPWLTVVICTCVLGPIGGLILWKVGND